MSLSWRTLDEEKKETGICLNCGTFELNEKVGGLFEKLLGISVAEKSRKEILFGKWENGVLIWKRMGMKTDIRYYGEIKNGSPDGQELKLGLVEKNISGNGGMV